MKGLLIAFAWNGIFASVEQYSNSDNALGRISQNFLVPLLFDVRSQTQDAMSVLPTEVSINRVLCPWLFELSPSEKSKGDQHYFPLVGASFFTAHSQKQRPRGGVRIPLAGTAAAIFLFLWCFSFLKQDGEQSETWKTASVQTLKVTGVPLFSYLRE